MGIPIEWICGTILKVMGKEDEAISSGRVGVGGMRKKNWLKTGGLEQEKNKRFDIHVEPLVV